MIGWVFCAGTCSRTSQKKAAVKISGGRSMIGVPLMRDGEPIGVIGLARTRAESFSQREIELVTTFADQAVIAIENVRLFDEVQARTRELQETLEYQTAASDVLNVIPRSPSIFSRCWRRFADTAQRLCHAEQAYIMRLDAGLYHLAAAKDAPPRPSELNTSRTTRSLRTAALSRAVSE